jgi:branched-chain amino acid transport system ATP-binding protein
MLELNGIHTYYGNIVALRGVSLTVERGEIVTLIGANGAGKTTMLNTIIGLLKPRQGRIFLEGEPIEGLLPDQIVRRGIAQSPEGRRIFPRMTVLENLELGAFTRTDTEEIQRDMERAFTLFPRLRERLRQKAGTLSGGEQQMLAIGRALMARPRTAILLVEQNARMALSIAHRGYVIQTGEIALHDSARALIRSDLVRKSYLGERG